MGTITFIKPPFNEETAKAKVKAAQDAWNTRNPEYVTQAYTSDSKWINEFFTGREPLANINPKEYAAVVFSGGKGVAYDFSWNKDVNRIASSIYE
jgi:nuclear transport factor 2 (NTF2) superfamily protein